MYTLELNTKEKYQLIDVTEKIRTIASETKSGTATVFVPHTTASIICNENEAGLENDILTVAKSVESKAEQIWGGFQHDHAEGNAHAHIVSALNGNSMTFIIEDNDIVLGTWQKIMFLEMDGPRNRKLYIQTIVT